MFSAFLDNKPLFYNEIDYTRMPRIWQKIKQHFVMPKIIHLIGTNGKGTTGRFLASALYNNAYKVGHYSSPHILEFNERIWINGANVSNDVLQDSHMALQKLLDEEESLSLSYFEYTTLLAMLVYKDCDYVVLEAGLGGEYDATAVFDKTLTLVTPIDYDHQAFLGEDITDIATTKLNAMQDNLILSKQKYPKIVEIAKEIALQKNAKVYEAFELLDDRDIKKIDIISKNLSLADYLKENLTLSISALKFLNIPYKEEDFKASRLFGRLSYISSNVLIDVGHNPLAASSIADSLKGGEYVLIYNTYKDKNYEKILAILNPIIKRVEIIEVDEDRIVSQDDLRSVLSKLGIENALHKEINEKEDYLVFGSFSVVEAFLKGKNIDE